ncbi:inosose dehydratase [Catenulispora sp. GAS73]
MRVTEPRPRPQPQPPAWAVKVATAPVNFGIYSAENPFISAAEYARIAADCGYEGTDLGPHGYLDEVLADADSGPPLAGGWHDLRFGQQEGFADDLSALEDTARLLRIRNRYPDMSSFAPKPTLACPPSEPLDAAGWGLLVRQAYRAASRCREHGLEPVFHHHLDTSIETPDDIDRLLELTELELCLDTGHLLAAGGDPLATLARWGHRVRHVHVKDALADGTFCRLGEGRLDLGAFLDALRALAYEGWIVVEQDVPDRGQDLGRIIGDMRHNRAVLAGLGV